MSRKPTRMIENFRRIEEARKLNPKKTLRAICSDIKASPTLYYRWKSRLHELERGNGRNPGATKVAAAAAEFAPVVRVPKNASDKVVFIMGSAQQVRDLIGNFW